MNEAFQGSLIGDCKERSYLRKRRETAVEGGVGRGKQVGGKGRHQGDLFGYLLDSRNTQRALAGTTRDYFLMEPSHLAHWVYLFGNGKILSLFSLSSLSISLSLSSLSLLSLLYLSLPFSLFVCICLFLCLSLFLFLSASLALSSLLPHSPLFSRIYSSQHLQLDSMKLYTGYVNNYDKAIKTLNDCLLRPQFKSFIQVNKEPFFH